MRLLSLMPRVSGSLDIRLTVSPLEEGFRRRIRCMCIDRPYTQHLKTRGDTGKLLARLPTCQQVRGPDLVLDHNCRRQGSEMPFDLRKRHSPEQKQVTDNLVCRWQKYMHGEPGDQAIVPNPPGVWALSTNFLSARQNALRPVYWPRIPSNRDADRISSHFVKEGV